MFHEKALPTLALGLGLWFTTGVVAGDAVTTEERYVISLTTDDFNLAETDISHLDVGESESVVTNSGRVIDLIRTRDGVDVYVDGVLLDLEDATLHDEHVTVREKIEMVCTGDQIGDCEHDFRFDEAGGEFDFIHPDDDSGLITRSVTVECASDRDGCRRMVWISDGDAVDYTELQGDTGRHRMIRMHTQEKITETD